MVKKISDRVANRIVANTGLKDDKEIYVYGLQIIFNTLISISAVVAMSLLFHEFWETIIFLLSYCAIRLYAGGLHASSNEKCMGIFVIGYLFIRFILSCIEIELNLYTLMIISMVNVFIIMWAPVEAYNNPIPVQKKHEMKIKAFSISMTITCLVLIALHFKMKVGAWGYAGVCWIGVILLTGEIRNKYVRREES